MMNVEWKDIVGNFSKKFEVFVGKSDTRKIYFDSTVTSDQAKPIRIDGVATRWAHPLLMDAIVCKIR